MHLASEDGQIRKRTTATSCGSGTQNSRISLSYSGQVVSRGSATTSTCGLFQQSSEALLQSTRRCSPFSRCSLKARLWCEAGLIYYFIYICDGAHMSMFIAGMFLCDIDLLLSTDSIRVPPQLKRYSSLIFHCLLAISIYLGGSPSEKSDVNVLRETPGWYYLSYLKPQAVFDYKWFYLFWASTLLVASIPRIGWLKKFFEMRFNQYMGKISFAFYLVHGPVLWTLGTKLYAATGWARESNAINSTGWFNQFALPKAGPVGLDLAFWVPQLVLLPVTLWLAEIATKLFDEPSVKFAQWLYRKSMATTAKY